MIWQNVLNLHQKFDEYEKDATIATLQNELKSASMKVEDLEKKMER